MSAHDAVSRCDCVGVNGSLEHASGLYHGNKYNQQRCARKLRVSLRETENGQRSRCQSVSHLSAHEGELRQLQRTRVKASIAMTVTIKYQGRSLPVSEGPAADVKSMLVEPTGLPVGEMKLVRAGKVVSDEEAIPAGAKCMLMRQPAATGKHVVVAHMREIVSGRVAYRRSIDSKLPHDELVTLVTKALRLPPCDSATEVRIFLPHARALMRPDLTLADYAPPASISPLEIYAVPCPAGLASGAVAAAAAASAAKAAHEQAERHVEELAAQAAASIAAAAEAGDPEALSMMNTMASDVDGELGCVTPLLPLSLADITAVEHRASAARTVDARAAAGGCDYGGDDGDDGDSDGEDAPTRHAPPRTPPPPPPRHPASLVPAKLRTGLMASADEAFVRPSELPASLLLEVEAIEASLAPPSAAEWEMIAAAEEERLEARCADLVCSIAPTSAALPSSPMRGPMRSPRRGRAEDASGFGSGLSAGFLTTVGRPKHRARRASSAHPPAPQADDASCCSLTSSACSACSTAEAGDAESAGVEAACAHGEHHQPSKLQKNKGATCKSSACKTCGTRLPLTAAASACKCGHVFCALHMHDHKCAHDYRAPAQRKLAEDNPKLEGTKLERM